MHNAIQYKVNLFGMLNQRGVCPSVNLAGVIKIYLKIWLKQTVWLLWILRNKLFEDNDEQTNHFMNLRKTDFVIADFYNSLITLGWQVFNSHAV